MAGRATKISMTDRWLRAELKKPHSGNLRLQFHYDAVVPGLNLLRTPSAASWGMTKRWPDGKTQGKGPAWRSLGAVYAGEARPGEDPVASGALTLAEARAKARHWLDMLARGVDPSAEQKRLRQEVVRRITFAKLREEHIARHWRASGLRKADEAERLLKKEFASWDDRPAADITADDVDSIITGIVDRGALGQARNVLGTSAECMPGRWQIADMASGHRPAMASSPRKCLARSRLAIAGFAMMSCGRFGTRRRRWELPRQL